MIWTTDARNLLKELNDGDSVLTLDSLTIEAGSSTLVGRGSLKRIKGRFELTARFDSENFSGNMAEFFFGGMQGPRIYSGDDFWKMSATTSGGVKFECRVSPASQRKARTNGPMEIRCSINRITLSPKLLDATDFGFVGKMLDDLRGKDLSKGENIELTLSQPEPTRSKIHAILPGVKCVLAEHFTKIEHHNEFLPTTSSERRDTFIDSNEERRIGLVEKDEDLHVYLEFPPGERSEEAEKAAFSALLDAVAFTHGCHPFPVRSHQSKTWRLPRSSLPVVMSSTWIHASGRCWESHTITSGVSTQWLRASKK